MKLPALFTLNAIVVLLVKRFEVPVIITVVVPTAAVLLAVKVTMLVLLALGGLKEAVTPPGRPDAEKLTALENPLCGTTVIVLVAVPLRVRVTLLADEEREKPGTGPPVGQFATKFVAFNDPMPVAKSQPAVVP